MLDALEPRLLLDATVVDLLVAYTPSVLAQAGTPALVEAKVREAVVELNRVLANSQVDVTARLVGLNLTNYAESGSLDTDLERLRLGDGAFANVQALRESSGADLVCLFVGAGDFGGLAYQPESLTNPDASLGFSVILASAANIEYTFAHEILHNLGAGHDYSDQASRGVPYAYGSRFSYEGFPLGDVMSYAPGRAPVLSGPDVSWNGVVTGAPADASAPADNARAVRELAPLVAGYRPSVYVDSAPPEAAISIIARDVTASSLSLTLDLADDTALDLSFLAGAGLTVTAPGFSGVAELISSTAGAAERPAVATVVYRLVAPEVPGLDLSGLTLAFPDAALRDAAGHVAGVAPLPLLSRTLTHDAGYGPYSGLDFSAVDHRTVRAAVAFSPDDPQTFARFTLAERSLIELVLGDKSGPSNLVIAHDANHNGKLDDDPNYGASFNSGTTTDTITVELDPGVYFAWAFTAGGSHAEATLTLTAAPVIGIPSDTLPPTATTATPPVAGNTTSYTFTVVYNDNDVLDVSSVSTDTAVRVTGPKGFSELATFISIDGSPSDHTRNALYRINAPGGTWTLADNGVYTISLEPGAVRDVTGNVAPGGPVGNFTVALTADTTPPTARAETAHVHGGSGPYSFNVVYHDATALNHAAILGNGSAIRVYAPGGHSVLATFNSYDPVTGRASYAFTPAGGGWTDQNAGTYYIVLQGAEVSDIGGNYAPAAIIGSFTASPTPLFDERFYLTRYADVAGAVAAGAILSGYDHFLHHGQYEQRDASAAFSSRDYLRLNPDVAGAVASGGLPSAFWHFANFGLAEGRSATPFFVEWQYLAQYADIAGAVAAKAIPSGFWHYILYGQYEKRRPSAFFDPVLYDTANPDVASGVASGAIPSNFTHFVLHGQREGRMACAYFSEAFYLAHNPDVAQSVASGLFISGYKHFLLHGHKEGRAPCSSFSPAAYLAAYPDVAAGVATGGIASAWEHFVVFGIKEGRKP